MTVTVDLGFPLAAICTPLIVLPLVRLIIRGPIPALAWVCFGKASATAGMLVYLVLEHWK